MAELIGINVYNDGKYVLESKDNTGSCGLLLVTNEQTFQIAGYSYSSGKRPLFYHIIGTNIITAYNEWGTITVPEGTRIVKISKGL